MKKYATKRFERVIHYTLSFANFIGDRSCERSGPLFLIARVDLAKIHPCVLENPRKVLRGPSVDFTTPVFYYMWHNDVPHIISVARVAPFGATLAPLIDRRGPAHGDR